MPSSESTTTPIAHLLYQSPHEVSENAAPSAIVVQAACLVKPPPPLAPPRIDLHRHLTR